MQDKAGLHAIDLLLHPVYLTLCCKGIVSLQHRKPECVGCQMLQA